MGDVATIVGIGGALRADSTSEKALNLVAGRLAERGITMRMFVGRDLAFPLYDPAEAQADLPSVGEYIEAVRACDGLIIASPVYHGGPSGLIKNAIDHLQPLATDRLPYLAQRPVCCIAAGGGMAGAVSTLSALKDVVHALRGWPTPLQVPINTSAGPFSADGACIDSKLSRTLDAAIDDLVAFVTAMRAHQTHSRLS